MDKNKLVDKSLSKLLEENPDTLLELNKVLLDIALSKDEDVYARDKIAAANLFLDSNGLKKAKQKETETIPMTPEERAAKIAKLTGKVAKE